MWVAHFGRGVVPWARPPVPGLRTSRGVVQLRRNRHCPKCQNLEGVRWREAQEKLLLPIAYHHVVFVSSAESVGEFGLAPSLSLYTTNLIENLNGALRRLLRRVKRWRGGSMSLRWGATAAVEAEHKFRRIKGYRHMPALIISALAAVCSTGNSRMLDIRQKIAKS